VAKLILGESLRLNAAAASTLALSSTNNSEQPSDISHPRQKQKGS